MSPLHIQMATSGVSDASQLTAMRLPELHPSTIWSTDPASRKTFVLAPSPRALGTSAPLLINLPAFGGCPAGEPQDEWGGQDPHEEPRNTVVLPSWLNCGAVSDQPRVNSRMLPGSFRPTE